MQSRETILNAAARLATLEGLEGMSIGRLAEYIGMSKSGLYAHFGSKEELQLATVKRAGEIFEREVIRPTETVADPLERLLALCRELLAYLERDVFPGGCFFVSAMAEFDTRPGAVRDLVKETLDAWTGMFTGLLSEAQRSGAITKDVDPGQLAWELDSYLRNGEPGMGALSRETPAGASADGDREPPQSGTGRAEEHASTRTLGAYPTCRSCVRVAPACAIAHWRPQHGLSRHLRGRPH